MTTIVVVEAVSLSDAEYGEPRRDCASGITGAALAGAVSLGLRVAADMFLFAWCNGAVRLGASAAAYEWKRSVIQYAAAFDAAASLAVSAMADGRTSPALHAAVLVLLVCNLLLFLTYVADLWGARANEREAAAADAQTTRTLFEWPAAIMALLFFSLLTLGLGDAMGAW